jgi:hypothetical protein
MGDAVDLDADRVIDFPLAVAVNIAPKRGNPVQVLSSLHVDQKMAFAAADDARLLAHPLLHLRERMPEKTLVELF